MFDLEQHGPDTFVGQGPQYPWGGLYGGQIVAQALRASAYSVDPAFVPHSIRAYFIRPGDHAEPVRYEVDRIRNGRSFATRRIVARQAVGAILNAECSFQRDEHSPQIQTMVAPVVDAPENLENSSFSSNFERRTVPARTPGRATAWMKVNHDLDRADVTTASLIDRCWLAYLSDDLATDAVRSTFLEHVDDVEREELSSVSLDHTVWFHRPLRADDWHLHDVSCHHFSGSRGLSVGHVFDATGLHTATFAQEVLLRGRRTGS